MVNDSMKKLSFRWAILMSVFLCALSSPQVKAESLEASQPIHWLNFRGGWNYVVDSTGSAHSGFFSWNPEYQFSQKFLLALDLGLSPIRESSTSTILLKSLGLMAGYTYEEFLFELGPELQSWGSVHTSFSVAGSLQYKLHFEEIKFLDRAFVTYQRGFDSNAISTIKFGVGIQF